MRSPDPVRVKCGQLGGRPRRYDLSGMEVGHIMILPWMLDIRGARRPEQEGLHQAVRREGKRLGWTFTRRGTPTGLAVRRIA